MERHLPAVGRSVRGLHWWRSAPCSFTNWCWMFLFFPLMLDVGCSLIDVGCHHFIDIWHLFWTNYVVAVEWNWIIDMFLNWHVFFMVGFIVFLLLRIRTFGVKTYLTKRPWTDIRSLAFAQIPRPRSCSPGWDWAEERCPIREFNQNAMKNGAESWKQDITR